MFTRDSRSRTHVRERRCWQPATADLALTTSNTVVVHGATEGNLLDRNPFVVRTNNARAGVFTAGKVFGVEAYVDSSVTQTGELTATFPHKIK